MFIDFNQISDNSRLWIYASETELISSQKDIISKSLKEFLSNWNHHGKSLGCSFSIIENRFIVISLDEEINEVGGCAIDSLQNLINNFQNKLSLSLLNRLNVFIKLNDKIICLPHHKLKLNKSINKESLFYDLTISHKKQLNSWLIKIKDGWCYKFL